MTKKEKVKLCFVAHEFGFFRGHGGVAAYLHNLINMLLERYDFEIHVIAGQHDRNDPILQKIKFHEFFYSDDEVLKLLEEIEPDFVEAGEFNSFIYKALVKKNLGLGFQNTTFILNHHTNVRDCFIWSEELPFSQAHISLQLEHVLEKGKFYLADKNIVPSIFLGKYIEKNYGIQNPELFNYSYNTEIKSKTSCAVAAKNLMGIPQDSFNIFYIARFEGRKKQAFLVQQFIELNLRYNLKAKLFLIGNSLKNQTDGEDQMLSVFRSIPEQFRSCIHFYDFMSTEQQENLLGIADVYVMASTFENFPFSVIDIVHRGIPVICSKYCGISDVLGATKEAMTFDPFLENDLANKLYDFYQEPTENRAAIVDIQKQTMETALGHASLAKKVHKLFTHKIETETFDIRSQKRINISSNEAHRLSPPNEQATYILNHKYDAHINQFMDHLSFVSTKLKTATIAFYSGTPPANVHDALEKGCAIALIGHQAPGKQELYKELIDSALARPHFIPVALQYTQKSAKKFNAYALRKEQQLNLQDLFHD